MAQFQAFSASALQSLSHFTFNLSKTSGLFQVHDKLLCSSRPSLFKQFGANSSGFRGDAVLNGSSATVETRKSQVITAVLSSDKEVETKGRGLRGKLNKVVLAYSGGLDTSVIVPWLRENYGCEVVCFTADVGQEKAFAEQTKFQGG